MNAKDKVKKYGRRILKWIAWFIGSIIALLLILALVIQIPYVQEKIKARALTFLEGKIGTPVALEHISIRFPKSIVLDGLYVQDQKADTLLYAGELSVNTDMWGLLHNRIVLSDVSLSEVSARISRLERDSAYNFTYIVDAFSDTTAVVDTTSSPWEFSVGNVTIEKTRLHYDDRLSGDRADLTIGSLAVSMETFDLNKSILKADEIELSDVVARVSQRDETSSAAPSNNMQESDSSSFAYTLGVNEVKLKNLFVDYQGGGQRLHLDLGEMSLDADNIDINKRKIVVDKIALSKTFISYHITSTTATDQPEQKDSVKLQPDEPSWDISVSDIKLAENSLQYYDFSQPPVSRGVDFAHLWVTQLNLDAEEVAWNGSRMNGDLGNLSFHEKSGFEIRSFAVKFSVSDKEAFIRNFVFDSGRSRIALDANAKYKSLDSLANHFEEAALDVILRPSTIAMQDIYYFAPAVLDSLPFNQISGGTVGIEASAEGRVDALTIRHIAVNALDDTQLNARGKITGLPDMSRTTFDIILDKFHTVRGDVNMLVPKNVLPESIRFPDWLEVKGVYEGTLQKPAVRATVTSNYGKIAVTGRANLDSIGREPDYAATVAIDKFHLGKLLRQEKTMGEINMSAALKGSGLEIKKLHAALDAKVTSFTYQKYTYRDFNIEGKMDNYLFSGKAWLNDKNLDFLLTGGMEYENNVPRYKFDFDLKNADFKALNLAERPLRTRGSLSVNMATSDFKVLNGSLAIHDVAVFNGEALYSVDSLLFASIDQKGQTEITVDSDLLEGKFAGTINLFSLPEVLRRYFNDYFSLHDAAYTAPADPQHFTFNLMLKKTELFTDILFPDLRSFEPGPIKGEFNSANNDLYFRMAVGKINYANVGLDSFLINVNSDKKALYYNIVLNNISYDSFRVQALRVDGTVSGDSIRSIVMILDSLDEQRYRFGGIFYSKEKAFQFSFTQNQVILNYDHWAVPKDNFVQFGDRGILLNNMKLTKDQQEIAAATPADKDSTLAITFRQLDLESLAAMITANKKILGGKMSGDFSILRARDNAFHSSLKIERLAVMQKDWGTLTLDVKRATTSRFDLNMLINGTSADMKVDGYYVTTPDASSIKADVKIGKIDLSILEPFTFGQVTKVSGIMSGSMDISGTTQQPKVNGSVKLNNARFTPTYVNSPFTLKDETIRFTGTGISLTNFEMLDVNNNTAVLSGTINTPDYSTFNLNLALTTRNFQFLNTTEADNELFYGKIGVNAKARITGTTDQPDVNVNASLSEGSELTYVVPQADNAVLEQKGIVTFVDRDAKVDPFLAEIKPQDTIKSKFKGLNLTANIELSDKEIFNIIVDAATGDKLSVQGNTTLTLDMDAIGNMELSGRYEISKGTYALSFYKFVKRDFEIEKGSTITWSGDPLNAVMDIRAINRVETSPYDLFSNQAGSDLTEQYRQRLPFLVYLNIKGELLSPEISFRLDMPQDKRNVFAGNVYARLQDINTRESDLNKQVFGLLILKRFIADNPFENQNGLASSARTSVSRLLSEQLNRLSENIKGIELSFDVKSYEDYTNGQAAGQTQLQLGVSKQLFNERLVVKLSGNVNIEGENTTQDSFTDYIGDLALEYKITEDGRLRITGFRNSDYDMIDGELTRTGAGLIYIKDYDTLRELFKANEKEE